MTRPETGAGSGTREPFQLGVEGALIYSIPTTAMHRWRSLLPSLPRLRGREGWGRGLPVARRQTRRCLRVLRGRYQGRGTAPVLLERRQSGERADADGDVHRLHRAASRHGWGGGGGGGGGGG